MTKKFGSFHKLLLSLAAGLAVIFCSAAPINAAAITAGSLQIDYDGAPGPLFNALNITPGYEETKSLVVTNTGKVPHSFSIAVTGDLGSLADVIIIEPKVLNTVIWSKTISQIAKSPDSNIIIGSIAPSGSASVQIRAYLPSEVGNDYQGKTTLSFGFVMGNERTDLDEPTDDDGQIGDGASTVATGGLARLYNRVVGAAQNLIQTDSTNSTAGEVKGAETNNTQGKAEGEQADSKIVCFWWWVLLIVLAIFLSIYGYIKRKREMLFDWVWPIFAAAILYPVHWIMHDYYTPSKWCPYFIWFEVALLVLYYIAVAVIPANTKAEKNG